MTDYEVIPDQCKAVIRDTTLTLADRNDHFTKPYDAMIAAAHICGGSEAVAGGRGIRGFHNLHERTLQSLYDDEFEPAFNDSCDHIASSINAFSEAVDYYVEGDHLQATDAIAEQADVEVSYPEVRHSNGEVVHEGGSHGSGTNIPHAPGSNDHNSYSPGQEEATAPFSTSGHYEDNS